MEAKAAEAKTECGGAKAGGESKEDDRRRRREQVQAAALAAVPPAGSDPTYWDGIDGLLRKATAAVYRKIVASEAEGGLREWLDDRCQPFQGTSKNDEHKVSL